MPGVSVTAEGPALIRPQTVITTDDGGYRFPSLPPGDYFVTFALDGFQSVRREHIKLTLQTVLKVDVTLKPATFSQDVLVVGDSPVVDVASTGVGTSFDKDLLSGIPTARDIWAAMALAPGLQMRGIDVGGSHAGTQTGFSAYGVDIGHRTLLEGIIVNNTRSGNSGYFDYGSFEEMRIGASGASGEAAGPGALLNFAVKSGGDTYHGETWLDYQNGSLVSDNVPSAFKTSGGRDDDGFVAPAGGVAKGNRITSKYDVNSGLGGRIIREKLWFYASGRDTNVYRTIIGLPGFEDQSRLKNLTGKVNYALSPANQLIGFYNWRSKVEPTRGVSISTPPESTQNQVGILQLGKVQWTNVLSKSLFLDLQAGVHAAENVRGAYQIDGESLEGVPVGRQELTTGQLSGGAPSYQSTRDARPQGTGSLTYWRSGWSGDHSLKLGFQLFRLRGSLTRFQAGDIYYYDRNTVPAEVDIFNTPNTGVNDDRGTGIYLQDSWAVSRQITLNLGLRYDRYALGWPEQSYAPNQAAFFTAVSTPAATLVKRSVLAPRGGISWDVAGNSRTVIKAFAGRFYLDPMHDMTETANPVGAAARRFVFTDRNGNRLLDDGELGGQLSTSGGAGFVRVDSGIGLPYGDELSFHAEREIWSGSSLRASYVYKNLRDLDAEVDVARLRTFTVPFTAVDLGPDNVAGSADDRQLSLLDRTAVSPSDRVRTTPGAGVGTPAFDADNHTVEFAFNRRLSQRWMLLASYGNTWSTSFISESSGTGADALAFHANSFRWNPNQRMFGRASTSNWDVKVSGRYDSPWWGISAASTYRIQSGYNWARSISVRFPNAGNTTIPAEEPDNRAPKINILDLRLEKAFSLGAQGKLSGVLDVFNALNAGPVVNFRTLTGPRFKEVIALLDPRAVRFGVKYRF